jgi:hypothetical protein
MTGSGRKLASRSWGAGDLSNGQLYRPIRGIKQGGANRFRSGAGKFPVQLGCSARNRHGRGEDGDNETMTNRSSTVTTKEQTSDVRVLTHAGAGANF